MDRSGIPPLLALPTELLENILFFLALEPTRALQLTCKRFQHVVDRPTIWRAHCSVYQYWESKHQIDRKTLRSKTASSKSAADWKSLLHQRLRVDAQVQRSLDGIIASQHNRIPKIREIIRHGIDAKDELLRQCATPDDVNDVLARRYFADRIIEVLHRDFAIREWRRMRTDPDSVPLERALGAFDMFVSCGRHADLDYYSEALDKMAKEVRQGCDEFEHLTLRQKALKIVRSIRKQGFRGVSVENYDNLQNRFLGYALQSSRHEALPLITVAIYCAVATRLGVDARPFLYPFHIYGVINAPPGETLDGHLPGAGGTPEGLDEARMFLDPFRSDEEISFESLRGGLPATGVRPEAYDLVMREGTTTDMAMRSAKNIASACALLQKTGRQSPVDLHNATSSCGWAHILVGLSRNEIWPTIGLSVHHEEIKQFIIHYDLPKFREFSAILHEEYSMPLFEGRFQYEDIATAVRSFYLVDSTPKLPLRRTAALAETVKYKVGQIFHHKRYAYEGVITGWDQTCKQDEDWINHMGVDDLNEGGRDQSFYHVVVSDKTERYVAQVNIALETNELPSENMMRLAGKYFKRWDNENHLFVSNIREQYPDD